MRRSWSVGGAGELWKAHSKTEGARDLAGLMATLTEDCVYEPVQTGQRWEEHEGAIRFYVGLLGAFPDIDLSPFPNG